MLAHLPGDMSYDLMAVLEFENGALGYLGSGWSSPRIYDMRIQGTDCNLAYRLDPANWAESHLLDEASTLEAQVGEQTSSPVMSWSIIGRSAGRAPAGPSIPGATEKRRDTSKSRSSATNADVASTSGSPRAPAPDSRRTRSACW